MSNKRPLVIWFTGLSASGKSTLASGLSHFLTTGNIRNIVLDGDIMRLGLCKDLGFSKEDREENCRRVAEVAKLMLQTGTTALVPMISPYRILRDNVRNLFVEGEFIEIHVHCPIEVCEQRDTKGLYRKARAGQLLHFTGISDPYEPPQNPDMYIDTSKLDTGEALEKLLTFIGPLIAQPMYC